MDVRSAASDLRRAGRFEAVREGLLGVSSVEAALERARCALILGRPKDADQDITRVLADGTQEQRVFAAALRASMTRDEPPPSIGTLTGAGPYMDHAVYYTALAHYHANNLSAARGLLEAHAPESLVEQARYLLLRGTIRAGDDDYVGHIEDAQAALAILLECIPEESYLIAFASYVIAALAREIPQLPDFEHLARVEDTLHWVPELNPFRFQLLRTLGWRALISNNPKALKYFARAAFYATTPALRAFAHLDRAEAAAAAGELYSADVERSMAIEILATVNWKEIHDESLAVLPTAARVLAGGPHPEAQHFAELAQVLAGNFSPSLAFAHGPRFQGLINEGISFAFAATEPSRAVGAGRVAYGIFASINYAWRAARLAEHLYALTGQLIWRKRAAEQAKLYPAGTFFDRYNSRITPRQQQILEAILRGTPFLSIAADLHIAESTVKTHAKRLYAHYRVRNITELRRLIGQERQDLWREDRSEHGKSKRPRVVSQAL